MKIVFSLSELRTNQDSYFLSTVCCSNLSVTSEDRGQKKTKQNKKSKNDIDRLISLQAPQRIVKISNP